tara:strand:- start:24400 stop:25203 length:804 start_codon:yes stop_codon:yes gene_type:complete
MKYEDQLKQVLIRLGDDYGNSNFGVSYAHPAELKNSSLIFIDVVYSFQKQSWDVISKNNKYLLRTKKAHPNAQTIDSTVSEMQSTNSSDALAMNIFCYPEFTKWKGTKKLFRVDEFSDIEFGFLAKVQKTANGILYDDATEVDVFFNKCIVECKLTESDFTSKNKEIVNQYSDFEKTFHTDKLVQSDTKFFNYQLIRNILAAKQYDGRFILICDMRRPDLAKSFLQTISCIKDIDLRTKCEIIYWQDIAKVVGRELQSFLDKKYGIN